jgi:hypothetical protein
VSNRFGLEEIGDCANCGAEVIGEAECSDCGELRYAKAELAEELAEIEFSAR